VVEIGGAGVQAASFWPQLLETGGLACSGRNYSANPSARHSLLVDIGSSSAWPSRAQGGLEPLFEWEEPDVLDGQWGLVVCIELASTLCLTDVSPVGGAVAGSGESLTFDEGLQEDGAVAIANCPIVLYAASRHGEELGREIAAGDPRQDEKAGVVDDQV